MSQTLLTIGAGPGIGMEMALRFGRADYRIGIIRRNPEALRAMIADLAEQGVDAQGCSADAHDPDSLRGAIGELAVHLGGLDVVHHAVPGPLGAGYGPMIDVDADLLRTFVDARVISALVTAQAALPHLQRSRGAMLFTTGPAGTIPHDGTGIVGVPQAALRMLTLHLRKELEPDGIFIGLLPVSGVPAYRDAEADAARIDIRAGLALPRDRLSATDVAEVHFRLATHRDRDEWTIGVNEHGIAEGR